MAFVLNLLPDWLRAQVVPLVHILSPQSGLSDNNAGTTQGWILLCFPSTLLETLSFLEKQFYDTELLPYMTIS